VPEEGLDWPPYLRARFGGMSDHLLEQAHEAGLPMVVPEVIPKSRRALEAAEYAREQGRHPDFHRGVFRRFYGEGQNLHSWETLRSAAVEAGLDPDEMQEKTARGIYSAFVTQQMYRLASYGGRGVPFYVFENKYAVVGLRPFSAFQEVMAALQEEQASGG